jgi:hypothetical protein
MPKGPQGQKRPADVIGNAVHVMRIATGEAKESAPEDEGKNPAAVALGRKGGLKGGKARWAKLTPEQRSEAANLAAQARWKRKNDSDS